MKHLIFLFAIFLTSSALALTSYQKKLNAWSKGSGSLVQRLEKLYQMHWEYLMVTYPEWATYVGHPGHNDKLTDLSLDGIKNRKEEMRYLQKILNAVPSKNLKGEDAVNFNLFKYEIDESIEGFEFPSELMPIHQMNGIQQELADLLMAAPFQSVKDYEDRLSRLEKVPSLVGQLTILMNEGLKQKVTPPKIVLATLPSQFDAILVEDLSKNPLMASFKEIKLDIADEKKTELQNRAQKLLKDKVLPSLKYLRDFVVNEYIPGCRESIGWAALPNGQNWYAYQAKRSTTTGLTPDEIHEIGLQEVKRIRDAMDQVRQQVGFKGNLREFDRHLREDTKFHPKSSEELMIKFREFAKRMDAELPKLFGKLPRLPYGIREMPEYKATSGPAGYYFGGSMESGRAAFFEANTYDLKSRQLWMIEALTLHEGVPGHHLQIALAQEMEGLPKFRKEFGTTAYSEGWGLYAESLGFDMGAYKDPYSLYGRYVMEIWRAIRLVVDTGMHSKGWSRDQAMQFFRDNGPFAEQQIVSETDRYISWAGQALAYKIGELKMQELRKKARETLKDKFNIREFHDQMLGSGSLPLAVLETKMNSWMQQKLTEKVRR